MGPPGVDAATARTPAVQAVCAPGELHGWMPAPRLRALEEVVTRRGWWR
ncbi:hypothetical protein [Catenuloplanes japonicus]|nr:hypothetical protein [Catenuloplanes japonicus]